MKFPYRRLASGVARPIIPITVRNGADNCILATEIGELIGLDIRSGKPSTISGVVAGQSRPYYLHDVEIEVGGWWKKTTVGFMPELRRTAMASLGAHL